MALHLEQDSDGELDADEFLMSEGYLAHKKPTHLRGTSLIRNQPTRVQDSDGQLDAGEITKMLLQGESASEAHVNPNPYTLHPTTWTLNPTP